jgi:hypothetical protein
MKMKLQNDDNVKTMFSKVDHHSLKEPIELDASLVMSFQIIHESLIWPKTYEEIKVCMDRPDEDLSLVDP